MRGGDVSTTYRVRFVQDYCTNRTRWFRRRLLSGIYGGRCSLILRPLLEHLRYGVADHLLVLVPVTAKSILSDSSPYQRLGFRVVQVYDQGSFHVLLRGDS